MANSTVNKAEGTPSDRGGPTWRWVNLAMAVISIVASVLSAALFTGNLRVTVVVDPSLSPTPTSGDEAHTDSPISRYQPAAADLRALVTVTNVPTHYIFVVDTSPSMEVEGFADPIDDAVVDFARHAAAADRVSVIAFDSTVRLAWDSVDDGLSRLPAALATVPDSETDVGLAIETAYDLAADDAVAYSSVITVLTDGENLPPEGSKYQETPDSSWQNLAQLARSSSAQLVGFAFGEETPDENGRTHGRLDPLVQGALPDRVERDTVDIDNIDGLIAGIPGTIRDLRTADALRSVAARSVTIGWPSGPPTLAPGTTEVALEVSGPGLAFPVQVTGLTVATDDPRIQVTTEATTIDLGPGGTARVPARISWQPEDRPRLSWHGSTGQFQLTVTGEVALPFLTTLDPRTGSGPTPVDTALSANLSRDATVNLITIGLVTFAIAALLWLLIGWMVGPMRLSGELIGYTTDADNPELRLRLRRWPWSRRARRIDIVDTSGGRRETRNGLVRVHARPSRELLVEYSPDRGSARRINRRVVPSRPIMINGVIFQWTSS